jgi:hypothetical protein
MCILEKFYRVIFCFLVLIGQYLSRNWLLHEGNNHPNLEIKKYFSKSLDFKLKCCKVFYVLLNNEFTNFFLTKF